MTTVAYKVLGAAEHAGFVAAGRFAGSEADLADGFIHLSTAAQLAATIDRHFAGRSDLVVLAVDLTPLGAAVRWEVSRGGALFPHVYGPLPISCVRAAGPLVRGADGAVVFPEDARG